jgi:hypothetical protein
MTQLTSLDCDLAVNAIIMIGRGAGATGPGAGASSLPLAA